MQGGNKGKTREESNQAPILCAILWFLFSPSNSLVREIIMFYVTDIKDKSD